MKRFCWRCHPGLLCLEIFGALLAVVAVVVAVVMWHLARGPTDLGWARTHFEQALNANSKNGLVEIGSLTVTWVPERHALAVRAADIKVRDKSKKIVSDDAQVSIELQPDLLMRHGSMLSRIEAQGGVFSAVLRKDGDLEFGLGLPEAVLRQTRENDPARLKKIIAQIEDALAGRGEAGALRHVLIRDVRLVLFDERTGQHWDVNQGTLAIDRDQAGSITARASGLGKAKDTSFPLLAVYERSAAGGTAKLDVRGVRLPDILPADVLPKFLMVDSLISVVGDAQLMPSDLDKMPRVRSADLSLEGGPGLWRIDHKQSRKLSQINVGLSYRDDKAGLKLQRLAMSGPDLDIDLSGDYAPSAKSAASGAMSDPKQPKRLSIKGKLISKGALPSLNGEISISDLVVAGTYAPNNRLVTISSLTARVGEAPLSAAGTMVLPNKRGEYPDIRVSARSPGPVRVPQIIGLWPVDFVDEARGWINDSIMGGTLSNANMVAHFRPEALRRKEMVDSDLKLTFDFNEGVVKPVTFLSPLTGLKGSGVLLGNSLRLKGVGRAGEIELTKADVTIPKLNPKGGRVYIKGDSAGAAMAYLRYFAPETATKSTRTLLGTGTLSASFSRPMTENVPLKAIEVEGKGTFTSVSIPEGLLGIPIDSGRFDIALTREMVSGIGTAKVGNGPARIAFSEYFMAQPDGQTSRIKADIDASPQVLDHFGVKTRGLMSGRMDVALEASGIRGAFSRGHLDLDFLRTAIASPNIAWKKSAATPGTGRINFATLANGDTQLSAQVDMAGAKLRMDSALASGTGQFNWIRIDDCVVPDVAAFALNYVRRGSEADLAVNAPFVRLTVPEILGVISGLPKSDGPAIPRMTVRAEIGDYRPAPGSNFSRARFMGTLRDGYLMEADAVATDPGQNPVTFEINPRPAPSLVRDVVIKTRDFGTSADIVGRNFNIVGGTANAVGTLSGKGDLDLTLTGSNFKLRKAPALASLFSVASLRGLADVLAGDGVSFTKLESSLKVREHQILISEALVSGPGLGLTASGTISPRDETLKLNGVLVPSYGMNAALGQVPLVGDLFVSHKGEGMFAMTWELEGPYQAARAAANPLSALAPGIFRRMFEPVPTFAANEPPAAPGVAPKKGP